jgi:asparagine synthase (glutamine-hydrolysing)
MCGIAGIIAPTGFDPRELRVLSDALEHRGPNGFGYLLASAQGDVRIHLNSHPAPGEQPSAVLGFAHRRLSILDLSDASLQPMADESGNIAVCYNGELYNCRELRDELRAHGFAFRTTGDTEVLVQAYRAWGPDCVKRFNGMWAFALYDRRARTVLLSRDRFGIKPLHYALHAARLYFASEIKALLAIPGLRRMPNLQTVSLFLQTGLTDTTDDTFFDGIARLPAAHYATVSLVGETTSVRPHRYWDLPGETVRISERDAVDRFRTHFVDAVRSHTLSDVPVGTCLSGGLDSSSIVCAATELRRRADLTNYTHRAYGYVAADARFSEKRYMDAVANATGVEMSYVECSDHRFLDTIPHVIAAQDEPFGSASIAVQYLVFERARQTGVTVMLDGQGADEVLGGYHHLLAGLAQHFLTTRQLLRYLRLRRRYAAETGASFPIADRTAAAAIAPDGLRRFALRARSALGGGMRAAALAPAELGVLTAALRDAAQPDAGAWRPTEDLNDVLESYVRSLSLPALLRYEDRNSMAHSIEARVPFLDHRLVEFAFSLPDHLKINGARTKHVLREAMAGVLPESVRTRKDKLGFKATPALTFNLVQRDGAALATPANEYEAEWFDTAALRRMVTNANRADVDEFFLWRVYSVKKWLRHASSRADREPPRSLHGSAYGQDAEGSHAPSR